MDFIETFKQYLLTFYKVSSESFDPKNTGYIYHSGAPRN